jgi:hypothetical protein
MHLNRKIETEIPRERLILMTKNYNATPTSVVGDHCFDACFSQLEPVNPGLRAPSGGADKITVPPLGGQGIITVHLARPLRNFSHRTTALWLFAHCIRTRFYPQQ